MLKKVGALLGLGILLLAVTHFALAQPAADTSPAGSPADDSAAPAPVVVVDEGPLIPVDSVRAAAESTTGRWGIDPVTWEIVGPPEDADALALYNSPDQAESRRLAALAFTDPDEYLRLFPKTPEQEAAEAQANYDIAHPKTYAEHRASQTAEQNAAEDAIIADFQRGILANSLRVAPPDTSAPPNANPPPSPSSDTAAPATPNQN